MKIFIRVLIFVILIISVNIATFNRASVFNSSDEASNYQAMKLVSNTNKLYYTDPMAKYDLKNNLHSRGFIYWKEKIVPFNFLGIPIFYGTLNMILGENLKYINILYLIMIIFSGVKILKILDNTQSQSYNYYLLSLSLCGPIIYYLNHPYFNATPSLAFFCLSFYYIIRYVYSNSENKLTSILLASMFTSISLWFAYYWVLFYLFIYGYLVISNIKNIKTYLPHWLSAIGIVTIVFLIPLMLLNNHLYGSPFTIGYGAFTKTYFLQERASSTYQSIVTFLLPSRSIDLNILLNNLKTSLFYISPIYLYVSYLGIVLMIKKYPRLNFFVPLLIWFIAYNGMSDTYLSGSDQINYATAILRYWLPIYFLLSISFSYYLNIQKSVKTKLLIVLCSLISMPFLYTELYSSNQILKNFESINTEYQSVIIPNSYIVAPISDKYLFQVAKPIIWWMSYSDNKFFDPKQLNLLIVNLINENQNVYLERGSKIGFPEIDLILDNNLKAKQLSYYLYKIELL